MRLPAHVLPRPNRIDPRGQESRTTVRKEPSTRTGLLRAARLPVAGMAAWAGLIAASHVWGVGLVRRVPQTRILAAPLVGRFDPHLHPQVVLPIAMAALTILWVPRLVVSLGWRRLVVVAFLAAAAWAASVALADGLGELTRANRSPNDYLVDVPFVGSPGPFLSHFVSRIGRYHQHVRAHPPGMVLTLWAMNRVGLRGPGWEALLEILGGAAMTPAALIALKDVAGEGRARAAAPFVAFAPAVVWIATTGDAFFGGVAAWGIALVILAISRAGPRSDALALAGGVLLGCSLFLTYGVIVLAVVPLVVAIRHRRVRPLLVATAGVGAVVLAFARAGFWWPAGLGASLVQYRASAARFRPQGYFWFGNLGAFAIAVGPATAVGLAKLRVRGTWLLVGGALLAVALADASGLSKAEVERIWLPFTPWILLAGSAVADHPLGERRLGARSTGQLRGWLALTLGAGVALQLLLGWTW